MDSRTNICSGKKHFCRAVVNIMDWRVGFGCYEMSANIAQSKNEGSTEVHCAQEILSA